MMCGAVAGRKGQTVLLIDHADKPGEKIRISGGGRCNFTNLYSGPQNFISENPHFCRSALARYTPQDFIDLVDSYGIRWHEKTLGQLFCDGRSQEIINMLVSECEKSGNKIWLGTSVINVKKSDSGFIVTTERQSLSCQKLVVACGGASIPKMGATRLGYKIAEQFGLDVTETRPALVPLTFTDELKAPLKALTGVSVTSRVSFNDIYFDEELLFTHRGLSGPAILQISSYWREGESLNVNLTPHENIIGALKAARTETPRQHIKTPLSKILPQRLVDYICRDVKKQRLADMSDKELINIALQINNWYVKPAGTEGFRTAEVTLGGVNTNELSSKTMESRKVPGLFFIGEVVDVTGHLGGHNFQWAWASGHAAGLSMH